MRIEHASNANAKGWYAGPWNSELAIALGYATAGIDEPHLHTRINEIYLVARGSSTIRIEQETLVVHAGDMLVVEPGEAHTFLDSTPDYFHFVIHTPGMQGAEARSEKQPVPRSRLGVEG